MKNFFKLLNDRLFSNSYQVQRIVILLAILLVVGLVSFGSYYYYDRYYTSDVSVAEKKIGDAEQLVRNDPSNPDARLALAETYMLYNRFEDAVPLAL